MYYDKPLLDEKSRLQALSVTDASFETPRGLRLGDTLEKLLLFYGWSNPELSGDGSLAPLYAIDALPQAAYWAWVQLENGSVSRVQCAVHALSGDGYTDAGVIYTLSDGVIAGVSVYGVDKTASLDDVKSNLSVVEAMILESEAELSEQPAFSQEDLVFSGLDYRALNEAMATEVFGAAGDESWSQDDPDSWMHTAERTGVLMTYIADADKQNERCDALLVQREGFEGPRGMRIGDSLDSVIGLFAMSPEGGATPSGATILYGDGQTAPYGILESNGEAVVTVNYCALMSSPDGGEKPVHLYLTFLDNTLSEIMVYSW